MVACPKCKIHDHLLVTFVVWTYTFGNNSMVSSKTTKVGYEMLDLRHLE
jgi:hypothetical protein